MNSKESQSVEGYPIDGKETWEFSCEANLKPAIAINDDFELPGEN